MPYDSCRVGALRQRMPPVFDSLGARDSGNVARGVDPIGLLGTQAIVDDDDTIVKG